MVSGACDEVRVAADMACVFGHALLDMSRENLCISAHIFYKRLFSDIDVSVYPMWKKYGMAWICFAHIVHQFLQVKNKTIGTCISANEMVPNTIHFI